MQKAQLLACGSLDAMRAKLNNDVAAEQTHEQQLRIALDDDDKHRLAAITAAAKV
jgi:hypothetical protein